MDELRGTFHRFESWLAGWPNSVLTAALLIAAAVTIAVALRGSARQKAVLLTYELFP